MIKNTKVDRGEIHLLPSIRFLLFTETVRTVPHEKSVLPTFWCRMSFAHYHPFLFLARALPKMLSLMSCVPTSPEREGFAHAGS